MKIIRIGCIKDGYNITKGNLYDIENILLMLTINKPGETYN